MLKCKCALPIGHAPMHVSMHVTRGRRRDSEIEARYITCRARNFRNRPISAAAARSGSARHWERFLSEQYTLRSTEGAATLFFAIMLCKDLHSASGIRHSDPLAGQQLCRAPRFSAPVQPAQRRRCQRLACVAQADSRPTAMVGAVAMDRPPLATEPISDSALPCPRQGIKKDATELIGYTPMVRLATKLLPGPCIGMLEVNPSWQFSASFLPMPAGVPQSRQRKVFCEDRRQIGRHGAL